MQGITGSRFPLTFSSKGQYLDRMTNLLSYTFESKCPLQGYLEVMV